MLSLRQGTGESRDVGTWTLLLPEAPEAPDGRQADRVATLDRLQSLPRADRAGVLMARRRKALFTRGEANAKTAKALKLADLDTLILHLSPHASAGVGNVCASASARCMLACLTTAGRDGIFAHGETTNAIQRPARHGRGPICDPAAFVDRLSAEIEQAKAARRDGRGFVVRSTGRRIAQSRHGTGAPTSRRAVLRLHEACASVDASAGQLQPDVLTDRNNEAGFEALAHGVNVASCSTRLARRSRRRLRRLGATFVPPASMAGRRRPGTPHTHASGFVVAVASLPASDRETGRVDAAA
jgi:hypothetical protein